MSLTRWNILAWRKTGLTAVLLYASGESYPHLWAPRTQFQRDAQSVQYQGDSPPVLPPSQGYVPIGTGPVSKPKWQSGVPVGPGSWVPAPSGSSNMGFYPAQYPLIPKYFSPFTEGEGQSAFSGSSRRGPPFHSPYFLGTDPDLFMAAQPESVPGGFPNIGLASAASFLFPENTVMVTNPDAAAPLQPVPPPAHIIQSRNGFIRVAHQRSRAKYSPDSFEESVDGVDPLAFLSASDPRSDQKV